MSSAPKVWRGDSLRVKAKPSYYVPVNKRSSGADFLNAGRLM
jgi:hypothetical protein